MIMPTLYDPKLHGEMTDEERHEYNRQLMSEIPEEDPDDLFDYTMYQGYMQMGQEDKAQEHKAGYEREKEFLRLNKEKRQARLHTKEEIKLMQEYQKRTDKEVKKILREAGIRKSDFMKIVGM